MQLYRVCLPQMPCLVWTQCTDTAVLLESPRVNLRRHNQSCDPPALLRLLLLPLPSPLSTHAESLLSGLALAGRGSAAELACLNGDVLLPALPLPPVLTLVPVPLPAALGLFLLASLGLALLLPAVGDAAADSSGSGGWIDKPAAADALAVALTSPPATARQVPRASEHATGVPAAVPLLLLLLRGLGLAGLAASLSAGEVLLLSLLGLCGAAAAAAVTAAAAGVVLL
jgi:hypothetical protein